LYNENDNSTLQWKTNERRRGQWVTRRNFAALVAATEAALAQQRRDQPLPDPFDAPIEFTRKDVAPKVRRSHGVRFPGACSTARRNGLPVGSSRRFPGGGGSHWERRLRRCRTMPVRRRS